MRKNILVTPLMAVLAASVLHAQDTDGVMTGKVTGPDNNPLQGVRVTITSPSLLGARNARTDANGSFRVPLLPPGEYSITYVLDGYITRRMTVLLNAGTTINAGTKLQSIQAKAATVEITAESADLFLQIDKTDTTVQTSFTSERMNEIVGREIRNIATLTPGTSGASSMTSGQANFLIRGGMGRGNKTLQDGQMINDASLGILYDSSMTVEDMIESVAIVQSPLNAKLGNTDGGIISITTKKGTNAFQGSLRYSGSRGLGSMWRSQQVNYPDRRGAANSPGIQGNDTLSKSWEFTLRGPIIPNHLTFAYGGTINPSTMTPNLYRSLNGQTSLAFAPEWNRTDAEWNHRKGTWYLDTGRYGNNGDVIRKSDWGSLTSADATYVSGRESASNTFNLYWQVTPNHQLSYYNMQSRTISTVNGAFQFGESFNDNGLNTTVNGWNISYKGVIGSSGVLDARYGKSSNYREQPYAGKTAIQLILWPTYGARNGNREDTNFDNYLGNGIIDLAWNRYDATAAYRNPASMFIKGYDNSGDQGGGVTSMNLNYQHILEFKGTHIIDLGFNRESPEAPAVPTNAEKMVSPVGLIDRNLLQSDVRNIYGLPTANASAYRGKYIVFNVKNTMISHLEPQALGRPLYGTGDVLVDDYIWQGWQTPDSIGTFHPQLRNQMGGRIFSVSPYAWEGFLPYMRLDFTASDNAAGAVYTNTNSFYINDMWTITNNHSVMLGIRVDQLDLKGDSKTVFKYTKLTPRFEYKFDPFGDQKHLFSFSYAQFHQMANLGLYWPFVDTKFGGRWQKLWSVGQPGYQLVDEADLLNPDNYEVDMVLPTYNPSLDNKIEKGFEPPTSTEYSFWYRRAFENGGSLKVTFMMRGYDNLYDFYMDEPYFYGSTYRLKTLLKNTKDFNRNYSGVELQWDAPITRKIAFGGHYTYARLMHNQTNYGTSANAPTSTTQATIPLQSPAYFDKMFEPLVNNFIAGYAFGSARDMWAPTLRQNQEFNLVWYITLNLSQGKARSTLALQGGWSGATFLYDTITTRVGYEVIKNINSYPSERGNAGSAMVDSQMVRVNEYTGTNSLNTGNLRYTLTLPLTGKLSWFLNSTITNLFLHKNKNFGVPGGNSSTSGNAETYIPFAIPSGPSTWVAATNPDTSLLRNGYYVNGNVASAYSGRAGDARSISLSTGLRF